MDRPEGFLVLAVASLGEDVTELTAVPQVHVLIDDRVFACSRFNIPW